MRKALALAEKEGYVRPFIDRGQPMVHLLYEALARKIHPDYAAFLLSQFPDYEELTSPKTASSNLIEALSSREIEILNLLAQGLSNREIAAQLFLTLNTIKVHNRNIFGKLNVKNRTQAVTKGRQLGLIVDTRAEN